jgi:hypothetical protein
VRRAPLELVEPKVETGFESGLAAIQRLRASWRFQKTILVSAFVRLANEFVRLEFDLKKIGDFGGVSRVAVSRDASRRRHRRNIWPASPQYMKDHFLIEPSLSGSLPTRSSNFAR